MDGQFRPHACAGKREMTGFFQLLLLFAIPGRNHNQGSIIVIPRKAARTFLCHGTALMIPSIPLRTALAALASLLSLGAASHASTVGLTLNAGDNYAVWDTFPGNNFASDAPDLTSGLTSASLGLASSGIATGGGARLYDAGGNAGWSAEGSTAFDIVTFQLEVKNYNFTSQSINGLFNPTVNGLAFDHVSISLVPEAGLTHEVVTWTWTAALASAAAAQNFSVAFSEPGAHISIDAVAIHASAVAIPVPEVSTSLLALGGMAMMGAARRRRRNA